jgi:hypothetical protein
MFSDQNPVMQPVKALAESVRAARRPVSKDNPLLAIEQAMSSSITSYLQTIGEFRDAMTETVFLNTYGSPQLQAMLGLEASQNTHHGTERDLVKEASAARLRSEQEQRFEAGDPIEAALRALIYIRLPDGSIDERGFNMLKLIRASRPADKRISMVRLKEMVRQQHLLVCLDEERAITALPKLLGADAKGRKATLDILERVLSARGDMSDEGKRRLARIEALFGLKPQEATKTESAHA